MFGLHVASKTLIGFPLLVELYSVYYIRRKDPLKWVGPRK